MEEDMTEVSLLTKETKADLPLVKVEAKVFK